MAYADCSIIALTNDDPRLCDCNKIIDSDQTPLSTGLPDKQKDLSLKADWKYLGETVFAITRTEHIVVKSPLATRKDWTDSGFTDLVFHPPCV